MPLEEEEAARRRLVTVRLPGIKAGAIGHQLTSSTVSRLGNLPESVLSLPLLDATAR